MSKTNVIWIVKQTWRRLFVAKRKEEGRMRGKTEIQPQYADKLVKE